MNKNDSSIPLQTRNLCFRKVTEGGKSPSTVVKLDIKFCHVRVCRKKKISKNVGKKSRFIVFFREGEVACGIYDVYIFMCYGILKYIIFIWTINTAMTISFT